MDPVYESILMLLGHAQAIGCFPRGEAERLIDAVRKDYDGLQLALNCAQHQKFADVVEPDQLEGANTVGEHAPPQAPLE